MIAGAWFDGHRKRWVGFDSRAYSARGFGPAGIWYIQKRGCLWLRTSGIYPQPAVVVALPCSPAMLVGVWIPIHILILLLFQCLTLSPIRSPILSPILSKVLFRKVLILTVDEVSSSPSGCCLQSRLTVTAYRISLVSRCLPLGRKVRRWSRIYR